MPESAQGETAPPRVGIIGAGAVGSALLVALGARGDAAGLAPVAITSRRLASAQAAARRVVGVVALADADALAARCDLIFIATRDDAIQAVAEAVAWRAGQGVVHLSGALGLAPLAAAAARGAQIAALHPLMTFPREAGEADAAQLLARFAGTNWALQCDDATLARRLTAFVVALAGQVIRLTEEDRAPYHLSGVLVSNYLVTLADAAARLWAGWGVERDEALRALLPLLRATVANLETVGLPAALTGPIARGDVGAVRIHEAWLRAHTGEAMDAEDGEALCAAYDALARLTLPLAREKGGLSEEAAAEIRHALGADGMGNG